ncbi:MAG: hypothetical protein ACI9EF_000971 [Pseudohongiellaceae bacterium]
MSLGAALLLFGDKIADLTGVAALSNGSPANLIVSTLCIAFGFIRLRGR